MQNRLAIVRMLWRKNLPLPQVHVLPDAVVTIFDVIAKSTHIILLL
ncbi:MAG: hypothetical protein Q8R18_05495 [bacterium]|nr:hypothetical protein [bacterium]